MRGGTGERAAKRKAGADRQKDPIDDGRQFTLDRSSSSRRAAAKYNVGEQEANSRSNDDHQRPLPSWIDYQRRSERDHQRAGSQNELNLHQVPRAVAASPTCCIDERGEVTRGLGAPPPLNQAPQPACSSADLQPTISLR